MSAPASTVPSPSETSFDVQSLHHPTEQAVVQVPQAQTQEQLPAGVSAMTGKAFLAKKMAASGNSFYSPTDALMSPCTARLHNAKKKHYTKGKPLSLSNAFQQHKPSSQLSDNGFLSVEHAHRAQEALGADAQQPSTDMEL